MNEFEAAVIGDEVPLEQLQVSSDQERYIPFSLGARQVRRNI